MAFFLELLDRARVDLPDRVAARAEGTAFTPTEFIDQDFAENASS